LARGEAIPLDLHYQAYSDHLTTKARTKADDARAIAFLMTWCSQNGVRPNIHEISKQRARLFIDALPALANGIGPATVSKYLNRLACYWKWLEEREYAAVNVWRGVTIAKPLVMDDEKGRPFTDDEMRTLLEGPAPDHMQALMRIGALSGARLDAIVCLTVGDCADGAFRFKPQKKETGFRLVPIHSALKEIIARRTKGRAADAELFPEWPAPKKADSQREKSFKASNAFTAYRRSVGVDEVVPGQRRSLVVFHSFRKWFITKAERAHQPESIIASVVGHKRKGMTLGVYSAGPSAAQFRKCVEAVKLPPPPPQSPLPAATSPKKRKAPSHGL
jgi:integrase